MRFALAGMKKFHILGLPFRRLIYLAVQLTENATMIPHYDKRQEPDGIWTVVQLPTAEPAKLNGQFYCILRRDES